MSIYLIIAIIAAIVVLFIFYQIFLGSSNSVIERALALAAMGNFLDAKGLLRDQMDLEPDNPRIPYAFSKIYSMENDLESEVQYLEKIKTMGKYDKEFTPIQINNRIGSIYYHRDKFDEAFFTYLDSLKIDPTNTEALIRLFFMAVSQKDFEIADKFMRQVNDSEVRLPSYFIAKGVVTAMLGRDNEYDFFRKSFEQEQDSQIARFLYAISLLRNRQFKEALDIVKPLADVIPDDVIRIVIFQFMMICYANMSDYAMALMFAKQCIDMARRNEWISDLADSNYYYALYSIASDKLEEASEYLIEAEAEKTADPDIMNLANYKYDLEEGTAKPGETSFRGFNLKVALADVIEKLFPKERYFDISNLKSSEVINIRGIINEKGEKIISSLNQLSPDKLAKFVSVRSNAFKNICQKMITEFGYKMKREIPVLESEGADYICANRSDENDKAIFRIRKWKKVNISDVFLTELISEVTENGAKKGFIIGDAELTPGAKKVMKANEGVVTIISGKDLESLLEKVIK